MKDQQGILDPEPIADPYGQTHNLPRNALTRETEPRPWPEPW